MTEEPSQADLDAFLGTPADAPWRRRALWAGGVIILIALLLLLTRCYNNSGVSQYITEEVKRGPLNVSVSATGNLAPTNQVEVGSEVSGTVAQVLVDFNDRVKKGQTLAIIDTDLLDDTIRQSQATLGAREADVNQARATLAEAQATLSRFQQVSKLSGGKVPAKTEMESAIATRDRAQAAVRSAEANVVAAQADLSSNQTRRQKAVIKAPVTGVVLSREIEPGQTVAASFNTPTLFIIAEDLASMQLEVAIDEADVGQVKSGQRATFTVDAYPGESFPATIERVNVGSNNLATSSSSGSSGSSSAASTSSVIAFDAILTVDNKGGQLRPGMTATADIAVQSLRDALLVPNSALRFTPGQSGASSKQEPGLMTGMTARPRGRRSGGQQERKIGAGSVQTIYVVGSDGQPQPIEVTTMSSDGRNTAVESKDLKPGMEVITGQRAAQ